MFKFFKLVAGSKFYCDEKGVLAQKDGANVEVPASDATAVDVESGVDEATKMLSEAMQKAIAAGDKAAQVSIQKAQEAVSDFFDSVVKTAKSKTVKVDVTQNKASFDVASVVAGLKEVASGNRQALSFELKNVKSDLEYLAKSTDRGDLTGDVIVPDLEPEITRDPVRLLAGFKNRGKSVKKYGAE